mmetsp:Transcript_6483/g.10621  ORF Transcript_6483/g.10621 Transcript_6483/m.10621 type:complete len:155 (-) Transcript_6483:310-774(-)
MIQLPSILYLDITVDFPSLSPGPHGIAVHQWGDMSDGGANAGGHYSSSEDHVHGAPDNEEHHDGDLGNILIDNHGHGELILESSRLVLSDLIGRTILLHQSEDDLGKGPDPSSKTDGNAGPPIACGIIARSAGLFENSKRVCACDGVALWEVKR